MENLKSFIKQNINTTQFQLICVLIAACLTMIPIPMIGIPDGYDLPHHLWFAQTYYDSILRGDFFPGWAGLENYGFGSIGIRYYPPIAYYLLAFTQLLTENWYDSFWIDCFFWMILGCLGVYFWIKETVDSQTATLAAILYAIVPYHLFQIYHALIYAEFAASGILPFCFWFSTRVVKRGSFKDVLLFSVSFSLLILTHIPTTITASISLGIYTLILLDWREFKKTAVNFAAAFALSFSATAYHLIRLISETSWVKHNSSKFYTTGFYDYRKHLFPMFISDPSKYLEKLLWVRDAKVIICSLLFIPAIIFIVIYIKKSLPENRHFKFIKASLVTGLFSVFILTIPSLFIWKIFPLLQKIQFPWRWLSITSLLGSVSFAVCILLLISHFKKIRKLFIYTTVFIFLLFTIFDITQNIIFAEQLNRQAFRNKLDKMPNEESCSCWWTTWADSSAFDKPDRVLIESRRSEINVWDDELREFAIESGASNGKVRVATFYHPYWNAEVNGIPVNVEKDDDGSILIPVPAEKSDVKLYFAEPLKNNLALLWSLATWIVIFGLMIFLYRRPNKNEKTRD